MAIAGYNPNDATQSKFLSSLALGETGNASNSYTMGYGGVDLSSAELGTHGFPTWSGDSSANTHAAGTFQFQPGTWSDIASKYNLDFSNPQDQNAGAWYLAQQTYAAKTGGDLTLNEGTAPSDSTAISANGSGNILLNPTGSITATAESG